MLGLGRASQYAGWWTGRPKMVTQITTQTQLASAFVIRPAYYADFTGCNDAAATGGVDVPSGSRDIDMTGLSGATNGSLQTWSTTVKVGTNWMSTAPESGFYNGFQIFHNLVNNGVDQLLSQGIIKSNNTYRMGLNAGVAFSPAEFDAVVRNRWISILSSTSDDSADFANWTGGTNPGTGLAVRDVVVDLELGSILGQTDSWTFNTAPTIDLSQQWQCQGTSDYRDQPFLFFNNDIVEYDRGDILIGAHYFNIGTLTDAAVAWPNLSGSGIGVYADGTQAWCSWNTAGTPTALNNNISEVYGYEYPMITGQRYPATAVVNMFGGDYFTTPTPTPPTFNQF